MPAAKKTTKKAPAAKKTVVKKEVVKKVAAKKATAAKKAPAKPAAAKKAPAKKATPAKKPTVKKEKKAPAAKKAVQKKKDSSAETLIVFTEILLDVCKLITLSCETTVNDNDANLKSFKLVHTDDFTAAQGVLKCLPEEARFPMMRLAQAYLEDMRHKMDWDDTESEDESEEDEGEDTEEDDEDAERTAAILEDYARELEDDDDDGGFLFGNDLMSSYHFIQFKQVFTEAEANKLIADYQEGGALDKAMDEVVTLIYAHNDSEDADEDFEDEELDEAEEETDDEDGDDFEPAWKN